MSSLKILCVVTYFSEIHAEECPFFVQSMALNIDMNRISSVQIFLDLSENLNRCESLANIPLELDWLSINYRRFCMLVGLLEILTQFFPLDACF